MVDYFIHLSDEDKYKIRLFNEIVSAFDERAIPAEFIPFEKIVEVVFNDE